jgi:plastocyanin
MSKKNGIIVVVLLVVIAGGIYWMTTSKNTPSSSSTPTSSESTTQGNVITYSDSGFSPSTITVKSGDTITLKNTSSQSMQFDSDPHPIHTNDPELNVGEIGAGQTATVKAVTKGTHGYHNHLNPGQTGTIVVE